MSGAVLSHGLWYLWWPLVMYPVVPGVSLAGSDRLWNALRQIRAVFVNPPRSSDMSFKLFSKSSLKLTLSYIPETCLIFLKKILHLWLNYSESKLVCPTFPLFWFSDRAFHPSQDFLKPYKGRIEILWKRVTFISHGISNCVAVMIIS